MIECVKRFKPELKGPVLPTQLNILREGHVEIEPARIVEEIPPCIAIGQSGRGSKQIHVPQQRTEYCSSKLSSQELLGVPDDVGIRIRRRTTSDAGVVDP